MSERRILDTSRVADFISATRFEELPSNIVNQAKRCTLDTLAGAVAGCRCKSIKIVEEVVRWAGEGKEQASLIGSGTKVSLPSAALLNGSMATVLDSDDGCMSSIGHLGHIGGCLVPATLAVAEKENLGGRAYIEALVVGYEVYLKTSRILMEPKLKKFPLAGTPGTYGAAAAAGKLLKLTREQLVNALGIAEAYAPAPKMGKIALTGPMTKEAMAWGAMTGVTAALLAGRGFTGPRTIYDDDSYDRSCLDLLGYDYEMLRVYFKPYCACRYTHAALDIVTKFLREGKCAPEDVVHITVDAGSGASLLNVARPATIEHAQYSFPYTIGAVVTYGEVGPDQMKESCLNDDLLLRQADKVRIAFSEEMNALLPAEFGAVVTIETKDGAKHRMERSSPRGEPEEPLTDDEIARKFKKWAATTEMRSPQVERILAFIAGLENASDMSQLMRLLIF